MTGAKEKTFSQGGVVKPRPLRPQSKLISPRATGSSLSSFSKEVGGRGDCCSCEEDCSCFPWAHYHEFYAVSFSPPVRVANPIVRDNRFLFGTADHLDSFGAFRLDRQDILPYNPETCFVWMRKLG